MKTAITMKNRQQGATLITALVMLIVLTMLTFTSINSSVASLRVVGNAQIDGEAAAAAQQTIEKVISVNFAPSAVAAATVAVVGPYSVNVPVPVCNGQNPVMNSSLNPNNPDDQSCWNGNGNTGNGIYYQSAVSRTAGKTNCYAQSWDVQAQVQDPGTGANATLHQGVSLRVPADSSC